MDSSHDFGKCKTVFEDWAQTGKAEGMETGHWPSVKQAFALVPASSGNYLEIGCGNGYAVRYIANNQFCNGNAYGIDLSDAMIDRAKMASEDIDNIHFDTANFLSWAKTQTLQFDCIFSMEAIYYFPSIQDGLDLAFELLSPGGMLINLVDFYQENTMSHSWPTDLDVPMQLWDMSNYTAGYKQAGFEQIQQKQLFRSVSGTDWQNSLGTLATWGIKPK